MSAIEIRVPDIGDFTEVAVIEVLVEPGQAVARDQSLITVESDKASMEIPSSAAGVVKELKVKLGDKVSQGSPVLILEAEADEVFRVDADAGAAVFGDGDKGKAPPAGGSVAEADRTGAGATGKAAAPAAASFVGTADLDCDLLVLGAGPGGYSAAFRAADLGLSVLLVERYANLGGVCLNVGCIPSKALLHVAAVMEEAAHFAELGVAFGAPSIDLDRLRAHKDRVVARLTGGLAAMARARKVTVVRGYGTFVDPHHVRVELTDGPGQDKTGATQVLRFKQAIVAAGSSALRLPFLPDDARIVDATGALRLQQVPRRMLVIGGGIIGLEMATVYAALGARIDVAELLDGLMPGADRDLLRVWSKHNDRRFERVMLRTKVSAVDARPDGLHVSFEGEGAPAAERYDLVLQAVGRSPNGRKIGAERAGIAVDGRGFIAVDSQMRSNVPHVYAIGDIVGQPMLAHKAVHEAHVAAEAAAGRKSHFDARVIPSVAYTDPEIAWVGLTEDEAKAAGRSVTRGLFPWSASGRAIANGRDEGFTKLLFDAQTQRIVGGGIVGTHAGDLIGEVALAIEMGADAVDLGKTVHPHPTLAESIGLAAEAALGHCTDLPPVRRRH